MKYLGDFAVGATVRFIWSSNDGDGASITRATNGTISVYKDGGVTQSTTGITDTENFDGLTGIHFCSINTSSDAIFYSSASDFSIVLSGAVIDGETVNAILAEFSIQNRYNTVNVGSISAGAITATAIATNAIDADALATDAVTEINNGITQLTNSMQGDKQ